MTEHLNTTVRTFWGMRAMKGDFGVEIEVEGANLPHGVVGWDEHAENSLRGEACEYVTLGARTRAQLEKDLTTLNAALTAKERKVYPSDRVSTHIHLNFQAETIRTVLGFILVFTIFEPVIARLCGPKRNGNLFCLPSYDTGDLVPFLSQVGRHLRGGVWPPRGKYSLLNTDPLQRFGSIETRCFPHSIEPREILTWCSWLEALRTIARDWREPNYKDLIARMQNQAEETAISIFGPREFLFHQLAPNNLSELLTLGLEQSYEGYRALTDVFFPKQQPSFKLRTSMDYLIDPSTVGSEMPPEIYDDEL